MTEPKPRFITWRVLRAMSACNEQVKSFQKQWPQGAGLTRSHFRTAAGLGLDLD